MTRARAELIEHLRAKFGENADPAIVIDALFEEGVLDDVLACRYNIRMEFVKRYSTTDKSARAIHEDLAFEYGLSRTGVAFIIGQ